MTKLAELFQQSHGKPIPWGSESVQMMYELAAVTEGSVLRIEFIHAKSEHPQAVRVKCRGGTLRVNGESLDDIVLWADKSPTIVEAVAQPATRRKPMSVRVWNAWQDAAGVTQAWIGNSGLIVSEEADNLVVLRCSDGFNDPDFRDLIVRVSMS